LIPKTFHRIWFSKNGELEPKRFARFWKWLQDWHPDWEFKTWNNESDFSWLKNKDLFEKADLFGRRPDVLRYEILAKFGGIYVDTDVEPYRNWDDLTEYDRPFVVREVDTRDIWLASCVIGSPKNHPTAQRWVDELPAWAAAHAGEGPVNETGPFYLTSQVRKDPESVVMLPRVAFCEVNWRQMRDLGSVRSEKAYGQHHWASLWKDGEVGVKKHVHDISVLVPYTSTGEVWRDRAWDWVRSWLECYLPEAEIIVGTDKNKPFSPARALNDAYSRAQGKYIMVLTSDAYVPVHLIRRCVDDMAQQPIGRKRWFMPFTRRIEMTPEATEVVLASDHMPSMDQPFEDSWSGLNGMCLILPRTAWDKVGGMDERFVGWGGEDQSFIRAVDTLWGPHKRLHGDALHFWHPRNGTGSKVLFEGQTGHQTELFDAYRRAYQRPEVMKKIVAEGMKVRHV
jgi:hypothetical protein